MNVTAFFVDRWQFSVLAFVMLVAMGINAWTSIPRSEDPAIEMPIFTIVAVFPGASTEDVEKLVVEPLEEVLSGLDELDQLDSRISDGMAMIGVEFEPNQDRDQKYEEVLREVNALRPELPSELVRLSVEEYGANDVNILQLALVSETIPFHILEDEAERIQDALTAVPGIRNTEVWGVPERQLRVELDLGRLAQLAITPAQVMAAVAGANADLPGGTIDSGGRAFNVKGSGDYRSLDQVRNTAVGGVGGRTVFLRDVARVEWGYADDTHRTRMDGKRAVFITANQQAATNIQRVRDAAWAELDRLEETLQAGVSLVRGFDQADNVARRLTRLEHDFMIAIGIVLLTLLPLGWRAAVVVMVSIPLSLAVGVTLLNAAGFGINVLSIVGFVIALGLLVDDSIVVVENISRFLREGYSRREAAIAATKQITLAVIGATATLVFAFLPLMFLPGTPGKFIRVFPVATVLTVVASLLISLTIIPWLASRLLEKDGDASGNVFMRILQRAINASYAPVLERSLAHPYRTLAVAGALLLGSLALIPSVGFSLFPKAGTPQFLIDVQTPEGSSLAATDAAARFAEGQLASLPGVRSTFTNVGGSNPQIYYNVLPRSDDPTLAQLFVLLDSYGPRNTPGQLDSLRALLSAYPSAEIKVREFENGPPIDAPIAVRIAGNNLDTLRALASRVEGLFATTEGTLYVENPLRNRKTDLRVETDRARAGLLGISPVDVDRTVRLGIAGLPAGSYRDTDGDEHPIVVRLAHDGRPGAEALERIYVPLQNGSQVPLRQLADLRFESSPPSIRRYNEARVVTVSSDVRTGFNTDAVTKSILAQLDTMPFPPGYGWTPAGEIESRQESFGGVGNAVIVAVFAILAILVLEFRTFRSTLIVASVIPLGLVGGISALWLTGNSLSFTATIGFVALIGIEIKASILLVDYTNQLREEGMPLLQAVQRAGQVRFVPIVLTTLTAIGGLLPLALGGSSLYSPLAWVIIGGLVSSTLLARLVTPVMYRLLPPELERN
jgi:multidrug efflux pump subunit AcrB